jgi:hypothetical protein
VDPTNNSRNNNNNNNSNNSNKLPTMLLSQHSQNSQTSQTSQHSSSSSHSSSDRHRQAGRRTSYPNLTSVLARGATARALHPSGLLPALAADEMEKDLRHMQAYADATKSYRQQFFLQASRVANASHSNSAPSLTPLGASHVPAHTGSAGTSTHANSSGLVQLPVRIDPEEESRLTNLRSKIRRAEVVRAEAEQHYVASRAHYVRLVQDLTRLHGERTCVVSFLQSLVQARAAVVASQRMRLQLTRDTARALAARTHALAQHKALTHRPDDPEGAAVPPYTAHLAGDDPLTSVWQTTEDDYKKAVATCCAVDKRKKPLAWRATHLPAQPPGIPALLSAASHVPDKCVAVSASHVLGAHPSSLVWLEGHLGDDNDDETAHELSPTSLAALEAKVKVLDAELAKERARNQHITQAFGRTRKGNDEWVAMMGLLRQETEAVLHRHNTILQSAPALAASEKLHAAETAASHLAAAAAATTDAGMSGNLDGDAAEGSVIASTTDADEAVPGAPADEANDGDDEGSNGEDEEGDWATNSNINANDTTTHASNISKRPAEPAAAAAPEDPPRSKRRRL